MNFKNIIFIFALLTVYLAYAFPLNKRSCSKTYTVVKGDSCYKIWTKYGLTEAQLRNLNSGLSCSNLKVGTSLCVAYSSSSNTSSNTSSCKTYYTVKSGDSCYKIWTAHGLTESKFKSLNSGINCSPLKKGSNVCVASGSSNASSTSTSTSGKSSSCSSFHTVVKGESCYKIWTKYGLSESSFRSINSNVSCTNLKVGTKVCVKSSSSSSYKAITTTPTKVSSNASSSFTWYRECQTSKHYALTFDDGVYLYDNDLLDLLKKKGVKATFFINGDNVSDIKTESVRKTIKRMYNEGHNILSHTWSHRDLTTCSYNSIRSELKLLEDEIYAIIGKRPKTIRPPYMAGSGNSSVVDMLKHYGYKYGILWYVDSEDWKNKGSVSTVLNFIKKGLATSDRPIILNHSFYQGITKDKLLNLVSAEIDYLAGKGYKGVNMETCIGHNVYRSSGEGFPN